MGVCPVVSMVSLRLEIPFSVLLSVESMAWIYDIKWIINFRCVIFMKVCETWKDNQLKNNNFMTV